MNNQQDNIMTEESLGQDLGRLFEVGFNIGMLTYIEQNQLTHHFGDLYRNDLQQLSFSRIHRQLVNQERIINEKHREIIQKWSLFFLEKSFLAGLNLFSEYLQAIGERDLKLKHLEIVYYQCCFSDDNSMGTYLKGKEKANRDVLSQFRDRAVDIAKYSQKGEFLNADTLVLIRYKNQWRVLCIDYSIFSIQSIRDLEDMDSMEVLRKMLLKEVSYFKSKSVFSNLGLDTQDTPLDVSKSLQRYYLAFKQKDKETIKLIQAGSYTHSFSNFLLDQGVITKDTDITYNVLGYSDRAVSAMTLKGENTKLLETCSHIYQNEPKAESLQDNRRKVLQLMRRNAAKSFDQGKKLMNDLFAVEEDQVKQVNHTETITNFQNLIDQIPPDLATKLNLSPNLDLRQAHTELIQKQLTSEVNYLFLTGNPGIGKTSAIAQFLKNKQTLEEGFLFFYVSPRKQVNLDIIEKFTDSETQRLCDDRIFAVNTNANIINNHKGNYTVQYKNNLYQKDFNLKTVQFVNQENQQNQFHQSSSIFSRIAEDQIENRGQNNRGVLASICEAIYTIIKRNVSNQIIATAAIQSLKKTQFGGDTLHHFEKIFKDVYNNGEGKVIPSKMQELSHRIKHIFIMIDEITGDDSGVEFLHGITQILNRYGLLQGNYNFNVKIIVADASIVDANVIKQHLSERTAEPNKIFFRQANYNNDPLSHQSFVYQNKYPAVVINTNSYPANSLEINYKLFIKSSQCETNSSLSQKDDLEDHIQDQITEDIQTLIKQPDTEQIIVYIQNKNRLTELIHRIREKQESFQCYKDYLQIHASLTEEEKNNIHSCQNQVKVIFMTASASRGLSFPKTKHILIDVPRFEIEKNLMEIIQVIYRGRGYDNQGKTFDSEDKALTFYLAESAIYYSDDSSPEKEKLRTLSLQESILNLVNILLILKASILTRILGYGKIGNNQVMLIPIGRKSIFTAGETFSSKMSHFIQQLKREYGKHPEKQQLREIYQQIKQFFTAVEIILEDASQSENQGEFSYLALTDSLTSQFLKIINHSFQGLLNFRPLQTGYINGSLLIIPIGQQKVEEKYEIKVSRQLKNYNQLLDQLNDLAKSYDYPENLLSPLQEVIQFVKALGNNYSKTQHYNEESQYEDQYYAFPLFNFISSEVMKEYFCSQEKEPKDKTFRDILKIYLRSLYPIGNVLPIGYQYRDFPFLLFRSYSLKETRLKLFTDKYFLNSNELNILNLILYQE